MPMTPWWLRQLLVPARYLRIRHGQDWYHSKLVYDWMLPVASTVAIWALFFWLGIPLTVFDQVELSKRLIDLLILMIVFYMAALAAVSTFDRKGIDTPLKGDDALLWIQNPDTGDSYDKKLTYREFISYLFGYLSFLSLCLYVFVVAMSVLWPEIEKHFAANGGVCSKFIDWTNIAIFIFIFGAMSQLIITSLLGIYFLTERIQTLYTPDKPTEPEPNKNPMNGDPQGKTHQD